MLSKNKLADITLGEHVHRLNSCLVRLRIVHNIESWDVVALRHHFAWGGHVARLETLDPKRLTHRVLKYRDRDWLDIIEAQYGGRQQHGRKLRVWRWETPLVAYAKSKGDVSWMTLAADKRTWISNLAEMAQWHKNHRQ